MCASLQGCAVHCSQAAHPLGSWRTTGPELRCRIIIDVSRRPTGHWNTHSFGDVSPDKDQETRRNTPIYSDLLSKCELHARAVSEEGLCAARQICLVSFWAIGTSISLYAGPYLWIESYADYDIRNARKYPYHLPTKN